MDRFQILKGEKPAPNVTVSVDERVIGKIKKWSFSHSNQINRNGDFFPESVIMQSLEKYRQSNMTVKISTVKNRT